MSNLDNPLPVHPTPARVARGGAPFATASGLSAALLAGEVIGDSDYDRIVTGTVRTSLPPSTPLVVAHRALELLTNGRPLRILDVGAGVGKLSIVGALTTEAVFTGVEQQLALVRAARGAALRTHARRVTFIHGSVSHMEIEAFDAIYLFESRSHDEGLVRSIATSELPHNGTNLTWSKLTHARTGTRIVTYCSLTDPPGCRVLTRESAPGGQLAAFVRE